jgi:beta-lactamase class A
MDDLSRRLVLAGMASALALPGQAQDGGTLTRDLHPRPVDGGLIPGFSFELIELDVGGRLGVFVLDTETGRSSGWGENRRWPLNSTFKFLLAGAVLLRVDAGAERLDRRLPIRAGDLVAWSPVLASAVGQELSVGQLCHAAMTASDNAAANLLLSSLGGPAALTAILRDTGDRVTRIDRFEPALNQATEGDPRDTTTPRQMVQNMAGFLRGDVLSPDGKAQLWRWMIDNTTGGARIRAGVPDGWVVGDRTGAGTAGETSTIAAIMPPGRAPLLMAVYVAGSRRDDAFQSARHAELARIATANLLVPADASDLED